MYGLFSKDMASIVMKINCQAISLRLFSQRSTEYMMLVQRIYIANHAAEEAPRLVLLYDAIHLLTPQSLESCNLVRSLGRYIKLLTVLNY